METATTTRPKRRNFRERFSLFGCHDPVNPVCSADGAKWGMAKEKKRHFLHRRFFLLSLQMPSPRVFDVELGTLLRTVHMCGVGLTAPE
jgi:hypothetical protein